MGQRITEVYGRTMMGLVATLVAAVLLLSSMVWLSRATGNEPEEEVMLFSMVSAGESHNLALDDSGRLFSWGTASNGRLGNNMTTPNILVPQLIDNVDTAQMRFSAISAGSTHSLALDKDGEIWAWGSALNGQLGNGATTPDILSPIKINAGATRFVSISAGGTHSLALDKNGEIWSWGAATYGQIGNGTTTPNVLSPIKINTGETRFSEISAGNAYSLALDNDGNIWAWGLNSSGQLGINNTNNTTVPTLVALQNAPSAINLEGLNTLEFNYTGSVQNVELPAGTYQLETWGANGGISSSYAGVGGIGGYSKGIFKLTESTVVYIVVGGKPAVNSNGSATGGYNGGGAGATGRSSNHGGAGGGATHIATATGTLSGLSAKQANVIIVAGGGGGSGGGSQGGSTTISSGNYGGAGGGNMGNDGIASTSGGDTVANGGGAGTSSEGGAGGTRSASNSSSSDRTYNPGGGAGGGGGWYGGGGGAGGSRSNNGSVTLGTVGSAGTFGQGGNGGAGASAGTAFYACGGGSGGGGSGYASPTLVSSVTRGAKALGFVENPASSGNGFARIAFLPEGTDTIETVGEFKKAVSIEAGNSFSLAIDEDGKIWSWGSAANGRLGNGTTSTNMAFPIKVNSGETLFKSVSNGSGHSLAIDMDGKLWSWGAATSGKLGNGTATGEILVPIEIDTGEARFDVVSAGYSHSIAISNNKEVYSWGAASDGRLGNNTISPNIFVPTQIPQVLISVGFDEFEGSGTLSDPFLIGTADELKLLASIINGGKNASIYNTNNVYYSLTNDIFLNDTSNWQNWDTTSKGLTSWTPIGSSVSLRFNANFDGRGYAVKGVYLNASTNSFVGLFGYNSGMIKDVGVEEGFFFGKNYVGAVASYTVGLIKDCWNGATVSGVSHVGGIAGYTEGEITGCWNFGTIKATAATGSTGPTGEAGIEGSQYAGSALNGVYPTEGKAGGAGGNGSIVYAGGIVGYSKATINSCYNSGNLTAIGGAGGIGGTGGKGGRGDSWNSFMGGNGKPGGVGGKGGNGADSFAGGIVGVTNQKVLNSCNSGTINGKGGDGGRGGTGGAGGNGGYGTSNGTGGNGGKGGSGGDSGNAYVGGLVGIGSTVENCQNYGAVIAVGGMSQGGFGGAAGSSGGSSGATGAVGVHGDLTVGGIIGQGNASNCVINAPLTGTVGSGGILNKGIIAGNSITATVDNYYLSKEAGDTLNAVGIGFEERNYSFDSNGILSDNHPVYNTDILLEALNQWVGEDLSNYSEWQRHPYQLLVRDELPFLSVLLPRLDYFEAAESYVVLAAGMTSGENSVYHQAVMDIFINYVNTKLLPVAANIQSAPYQVEAVVKYAQSILDRDSVLLYIADGMNAGSNQGYHQAVVDVFLDYMSAEYMPVFNDIQPTQQEIQQQLENVELYAQSILDRDPKFLYAADGMKTGNNQGVHQAIVDVFVDYMHTEYLPVFNNQPTQQQLNTVEDFAQTILDRDPALIILAEDMLLGKYHGHNKTIATEFLNYMANTYMPVFNSIQFAKEQSQQQLSSVYTFAASILERYPFATESLNGFVQVEVGTEHSLALDAAGTVWTWGRNNYGQLGDGTTAAVKPESVIPVELSSSSFGGKKIVSIAAGGNHNLALDEDGDVWTWGLNTSGQLGDNDEFNVRSPKLISGTTAFNGWEIMLIAAGENHSMAVAVNGSLWTWGANGNGQLGHDTTAGSPVPVRVPQSFLNSEPVIAIAAGDAHCFAINELSELYSWGLNGNGQLGDGTVVQKNAPTKIDTGSVKISLIEAGSFHNLAITDDGKLYAWGSNANGQLGDGTTTQRNSPIEINRFGGKKITYISAGGAHSTVIDEDGHLWTWGSNTGGQLGDNSTTSQKVPALANFTRSIADKAEVISAGDEHTVVVDETGRVWSFGLNTNGQLGDGTKTDRKVPTLVFDVLTTPPLNLIAANELISLANTLREGSDNNYTYESATAFVNYVDTVIVPLIANPESTQEQIDAAVAGAEGMLVLKPTAIIITFITNGSTIGPVQIPVDAEMSYYCPADPTRTGYKFAGWYKEATLTTLFDFNAESVPATDITLHAKWTAKQYTIIYDFNGGDHATTTGSVTFGEVFNLVVPQYDELNTFVGWFSMDCEKQYTDSTGNSIHVWDEDPVDGTIILYAKWDGVQSITITFVTNSNDDIINPAVMYPHSNLVNYTPRTPIRKGHNFAGWHKDSELKIPFNFSTESVPAVDITLYGKWTIKEYTIVYNFNGGTHEKATGSAKWGEKYTLEVPDRDHYYFAGWYSMDGLKRYTNTAGGSNGNLWDEDPIGGTIELRAHWTPVSYEIKFETGGGSKVLSVWSEYGKEIPSSKIPYDPTKEFAVFEYWQTANGTQVDLNTMIIPAGGITLYAKWAADPSRLDLLVQELYGYLEKNGFEADSFEKFVEAMSTAADILGSEDVTVDVVKAAYDELWDAAVALKVANPDTGKVIPPSQNPERPSDNNIWIFVFLSSVLSLAAALGVVLLLKKRKQLAE